MDRRSGDRRGMATRRTTSCEACGSGCPSRTYCPRRGGVELVSYRVVAALGRRPDRGDRRRPGPGCRTLDRHGSSASPRGPRLVSTHGRSARGRQPPPASPLPADHRVRVVHPCELAGAARSRLNAGGRQPPPASPPPRPDGGAVWFNVRSAEARRSDASDEPFGGHDDVVKDSDSQQVTHLAEAGCELDGPGGRGTGLSMDCCGPRRAGGGCLPPRSPLPSGCSSRVDHGGVACRRGAGPRL
jgi:hypothetical protein